MKVKQKICGIFMAILAAVLMLTSIASGASVGQPIGVDIVKVIVNGAEVTGQEDLKTDFLRGDTLDLIVVLNASQTQQNVEVESFISGDSHHDIAQKTETFDVEANTQYQKEFKLAIPADVEQDNYKLRIMITDRYGAIYYQNYNIKIDTKSHQVIIRDIDFNPNTEITAGRSFTSVVRVENTGSKDEDNVKVTMEIPSLGLSTADYINSLAAGEKKSSEELYLRVPECTKAGDYNVNFDVKYNDDYSEETYNRTITITAGDCAATAATPKTTIVVGSNMQSVQKGSETTYDLTIANGEQTSKIYTIALENADWATTSVSPSNVLVVDAGDTKTAVISLTPGNDAAVGQKTFTAKISSADQLVKEIPLIANIQAPKTATWDSVKLGLEIGLVVLVLVLVVLGAVILIKKAREGNSEETIETEDVTGSDPVDTYY